MSMRDYGVDDYGMVLNTNHLQLLASKVCSDYSEKEWSKDASTRCYFVEEVAEKLGLEYIGEFDGEATLIDENGDSNWRDSLVFSGDTVYYIPLSRYPNLFHSSYCGIEDVVSEIKGKVGKYLPENFDYCNHIRHIVGTYFG